ncbi:hypothetical protein [Clostridium sp. ZBS2]|uniref:hypothetical protein n=1 Tax=Clostridium sp. ZBS2 TaxID=2949976 RepID=UPI002079F9BC|nr:hypothetical protein [Clostridium sp. ZBS2]
MSMQSPNIILFNNKNYLILDIEENKKIIDIKQLEEAKVINEYKNQICVSSCWRGYIATYEVEDDKLFLKVIERDDSNIDNVDYELVFSGCVIIVEDDDSYFNTDFIQCLFEFNNAYELVFEAGKLNKKISLNEMIEQFNQQDKCDCLKYINEKCTGKYGRRNYKWRTDDSLDDDEV